MKIILLLILINACAKLGTGLKQSDTFEKDTHWVYSPYDFCNEKDQICASGEGHQFSQSDAMALQNLASVFEVVVKSDYYQQSLSSQSSPWLGEVRQQVSLNLKESVSQMLELVQIKKRLEHKGLFYSLAVLDKAQAAQLISKRLDRIDQEMNLFWKKKSRTLLRKLISLELEREKLNERLMILTGVARPQVVSYEEIIKWRLSKPASEAINLKIGQAPDWLIEKLTQLLTESGFKVTKGEADKVISLNVNTIKEYLNVRGFEKYTFSMALTRFERGEKNRVLQTSETVTGRTQADALLKVRDFFSQYIDTHLHELGLD
jgi:hypothetical protein